MIGVLLLSIGNSHAARILVPGDYPTIQGGIDASEDGDTVLVADGTYTGDGNKEIDFNGKTITVKSANGADLTIIDCESDGRGFNFQNVEGPYSTLEGFTITNGSVVDGKLDACGGGIRCTDSSPTIRNCIIRGNIATGVSAKGGGLYCFGNSAPAIVACTIEENITDGDESRGGGIYCESNDGFNPNVVMCVIANNFASSGGGIYCLGSDPILINCVVSENVSTFGGSGLLCAGYSAPTLSGCTLNGNVVLGDAGGGGGVFCIDHSAPALNGCIINRNIVMGNDTCGGGVSCFDYSFPVLNGCTITENVANGDDVGGGGVFCMNCSSPILNNCTLDGNEATGENTSGGGVFCLDFSMPLLKDCSISRNTAENGGGIYCSSSYSTIKNCTIEENLAFLRGGGVFLDGSSPVITNGTIAENQAWKDGGGFYCEKSSPDLAYCIITRNESDSCGGGFYCDESSPTLANCVITENSASSAGGGFYCHRSCPFITNCAITDNSTRTCGGGVYCDESSPIMTGCSIAGNLTSMAGGGVYCDLSSPVIINCTIAENQAGVTGGGIYCWYGSSPVITSSTITENSAVEAGGGIYCPGQTDLTISNCILWNDSPEEIWSNSGNLVVTYSDIEGGWTGEGNIDADPRFLTPEFSDFHLRFDSPCMNTGSDCGVYEDIDGNPRPQGAGFDMGSDEIRFEGPVLQVAPGSFKKIGILDEYTEDDTLTISSIGNETLEYSVTPGSESWLSLIGEQEGVLQPGEHSAILMEFDISLLGIGVYMDTITIISDDPLSPSQIVPVKLEVWSDGIIHVPEDIGTIQEAIDLSCEGATVLVADGTYSGSGNFDIDFSGKAITVASENGASGAVIDCKKAGRGFSFHSGESENSRLEGFTILYGSSSEACGGGIYCRYSSPSIIECFISNNSSSLDGSGIYCLHSSPVIKLHDNRK